MVRLRLSDCQQRLSPQTALPCHRWPNVDLADTLRFRENSVGRDAGVAELADAPDLGSGSRKRVQVQLLSPVLRAAVH